MVINRKLLKIMGNLKGKGGIYCWVLKWPNLELIFFNHSNNISLACFGNVVGAQLLSLRNGL